MRLAEDSRRKARRELQRLPGLLQGDEGLRGLARATYLGSNGLVVTTDERVFYFGAGDESESDTEISFGQDELQSVEFRGRLVTLRRTRDPAREDALAGLRRFLTDTPLTLELLVPDAADLSELYATLTGPDSPFRDRVLSTGDPPATVEHRLVATSAEAPGAVRRWWTQAWPDIGSGALPLIWAGSLIGIATLAGSSLGFTVTTTGDTTTCTWDSGDTFLPGVLIGPSVAVLLVVAGTRRMRNDDLSLHGWLAGAFVLLVALFVYGGAIAHLAGEPLC